MLTLQSMSQEPLRQRAKHTPCFDAIWRKPPLQIKVHKKPNIFTVEMHTCYCSIDITFARTLVGFVKMTKEWLIKDWCIGILSVETQSAYVSCHPTCLSSQSPTNCQRINLRCAFCIYIYILYISNLTKVQLPDNLRATSERVLFCLSTIFICFFGWEILPLKACRQMILRLHSPLASFQGEDGSRCVFGIILR